MASGFMFATGVENSDPRVGGRRVDEMEKCGHYERWREDFDCVQELGIPFLRYGPPLHRTLLGPGRYDWEFADVTFAELRRRGLRLSRSLSSRLLRWSRTRSWSRG